MKNEKKEEEEGEHTIELQNSLSLSLSLKKKKKKRKKTEKEQKTKNARIVDKSCKEEESNVSMYCFEEDVNIDCMAKYEEDACSIDPSKIKSVT